MNTIGILKSYIFILKSHCGAMEGHFGYPQLACIDGRISIVLYFEFPRSVRISRTTRVQKCKIVVAPIIMTSATLESSQKIGVLSSPIPDFQTQSNPDR